MDNRAEPLAEQPTQRTEDRMKENATRILTTALTVIRSPQQFFQSLETYGGYTEPLIFLLVLSVATGFVKSLLTLFSAGIAASLLLVCASVIIAPLSALIFGFLGAGALYIVWKVLGSDQSFECAFRCVAYAAAVSPVAELVSVVPYIGPLVGIIWFMMLMALASMEVHHIKRKLALGVFGVLAGLLCLNAFMTQVTTRTVTNNVALMQEEIAQLTPEEAGKAVASFLRGFEAATQDSGMIQEGTDGKDSRD